MVGVSTQNAQRSTGGGLLSLGTRFRSRNGPGKARGRAGWRPRPRFRSRRKPHKHADDAAAGVALAPIDVRPIAQALPLGDEEVQPFPLEVSFEVALVAVSRRHRGGVSRRAKGEAFSPQRLVWRKRRLFVGGGACGLKAAATRALIFPVSLQATRMPGIV